MSEFLGIEIPARFKVIHFKAEAYDLLQFQRYDDLASHLRGGPLIGDGDGGKSQTKYGLNAEIFENSFTKILAGTCIVGKGSSSDRVAELWL